MRGSDRQQTGLFSYVSPEQRVPKDHPLRVIRGLVDEALRQMGPRFEKIYAKTGRPSIAPEKLLRALVLQYLYSIRSERLLIEELDYNLLYRWFVGLSMDDPVWVPTVFSKNRERLLEGEIAREFFAQVKELAQQQGWVSDEHFTVDGTLIEAWAGHKSFKLKEGKGAQQPPDDPSNPTVDFRGEKRTNETHQSTTDPEARLYRKSNGTESKLCYSGHVLMENRNGLVVDGRLTQATGTAEWEAAFEMTEEVPGLHRITCGGDKGYDVSFVVDGLRERRVTPHIARKDRYSSIDGRTTRHAGYEVSQRKRKRVEEIFGWLKTVGLLRKTRHRGRRLVGWVFLFGLAVYNLVRMRNLLQEAA
jgi:transposase